MRIAIVHYHLKRGGVTRVIESALTALAGLDPSPAVVVLAGEVPESVTFASQCREVPSLRYSNAQSATPPPEVLLSELMEAAVDALGGEPEIWHIHNHSLGKNSSVPGMVAMLASQGQKLLLQMHDFAEDGRPSNYQLNLDSKASVYPTGANIHYACINGRDYAYFASSDLGNSPIHQLPNAVDIGEAAPLTDETKRFILDQLGFEKLILYPVRAVRRKNFGELLLWASCAPEGTGFATTLGPTNRNFEAAYKDWKNLSEELSLPIRFGIGEQYEWPFGDMVRAAEAILTTSIAEGFGLAYLEPWLFDKPIIGRNLPVITEDFNRNGISLDALYNDLPIPLAWIDYNHLEMTTHEHLKRSYATYGMPMPKDAVPNAIRGITPRDGFIDFGGLDETLQETVIRRVTEDAEAKQHITRLLRFDRIEAASSAIPENAKQISSQYNIEAYASRLEVIYDHLMTSKFTKKGMAFVDQEEILNHYLRPEAFRLLRT